MNLRRLHAVVTHCYMQIMEGTFRASVLTVIGPFQLIGSKLPKRVFPLIFRNSALPVSHKIKCRKNLFFQISTIFSNAF